MGKIVTFGELMLRLSPECRLRFVQSEKFEASFGGAEANVAVGLANYGLDSAFVTKLPTHDIGRAAVNALRKFGVDTEHIVRGDGRLGIYYFERGAGVRPSNVVYDRAYSSIATAKASDFDWDRIFENAEWFHFSGITPALSDDLADICLVACEKAKAKGITVSCDFNFRSKLWSKEKALSVMREYMRYIDYFKDIFGEECDPLDIKSVERAARNMADKYGFKGVAATVRNDADACRNRISAVLVANGEAYFSKEHSVDAIDRIGCGDAFAAGLIYSIVKKYDPQRAIEFATAASCLKHVTAGDFGLSSVEETEAVADGRTHNGVSR